MKMYLFNRHQLSGMTFRCLVSYQNQFCTKTTIVYEYFLEVGRDGLGLQGKFTFACVDHFYMSYYQISRQEVSEAVEHCVQAGDTINHPSVLFLLILWYVSNGTRLVWEDLRLYVSCHCWLQEILFRRSISSGRNLNH